MSAHSLNRVLFMLAHTLNRVLLVSAHTLNRVLLRSVACDDRRRGNVTACAIPVFAKKVTIRGQNFIAATCCMKFAGLNSCIVMQR